MAKRGTPVTRIADGDEARAAAVKAAAEGVADASLSAADKPATPPPINKIDGITDEQARRIREAVRKNKKRQRPEDEPHDP